MKTLDELINEHYIQEDYGLERFVESIYGDSENTEKLKQTIRESKAQSSRSFSKVKRIVLIGEMRFKSLRKVAPKFDYADPTKLTCKLKDGKIFVDDGEYKFTLSEEDKDGTLLIVRSGYKDPEIQFFVKEAISMGILTLNDPDYVNISNNKYLLASRLDKYSIPQPKYVLASSSDIHKGDDRKLEEKLKKIYKNISEDSKFVCKILGGHGGKGVFKCTKSNIMSVLQCFFAIDKDCQILIQEYLDIKEGDIRAHVITLNGKQEILSVTLRKRVSSDFRSNLSLGNEQVDDIKLTPAQEKLVLDTAKASGLVWCGVDLLPLKDGKDVIIEYNGAPGPPSEIIGDKDELEKTNEEFYKKLIETIDRLC